MAVVSKQTVGNVVYYQVDAPPTHVAVEGSVALSMAGDVYINTAGTSTWLITHRDIRWGSCYIEENTTAETGGTVDSWYSAMDLTEWTAASMNGFTLNASNLLECTDTSDNKDRYLLRTDVSVENPTGNKSHEVSCLPFINNVIFLQSQPEVVTPSSAGSSPLGSTSARPLKLGDQVGLAHRDGGGIGGGKDDGYVLHHVRLSVTSIEPALPVFMTEDWETGSFGAEWNVVNGAQTNQWHVGTAIAQEGTYSAYISSDGGTTHQYDVGAAGTAHIYRDIVVEPWMREVWCDVQWQCQGEDGTDYGRFYVVPTSVTPVAGTVIDSQYAVGGLLLDTQATWKRDLIKLTDPDDAGTTVRMVVSFTNNNATGTQPPLAIDDLKFFPYFGS